MAENVANNLTFLIKVDASRENDLATIRHWSNLKIGLEGKTIWLKGFVVTQMESKEVLSIPYVKRFQEQNGKLFLYGSRLPDRNTPDVLWTPIERGLVLQLPKFNFNYFGINEKLTLRLVPSTAEKPVAALVVDLKVLKDYMETAPAVRLKKIKWAILDDAKALLYGTPLLSVPGRAYWQKGDFLIPAGFDFELHALLGFLNQKINEKGWNWVVWKEDGTYALLEKSFLQPLSISSFRMTMAVSSEGN